MRNDMKKWCAYGKGMGYLKNQEIQDCIRAHRVALDTALNMVGVCPFFFASLPVILLNINNVLAGTCA